VLIERVASAATGIAAICLDAGNFCLDGSFARVKNEIHDPSEFGVFHVTSFRGELKRAAEAALSRLVAVLGAVMASEAAASDPVFIATGRGLRRITDADENQCCCY
jgi:hypothetical protein